jgi:hypothetical protein
VANWSNTIGQTYTRGFIFWDYQNSYGYTYPAETYSRNVYTNQFNSASDIDTTNNTITLRTAWTGPKKLAGTQVSKCSDGGTYTYIATYEATPTTNNDWKTLSAKNPTYRAGTAFIKLGWYNNGSSGSGETNFYFTNVKAIERHNSNSATYATKDSDGNTINATYFKSSGNTTLVAGAATKIGTQNGADVKLTINAMTDTEVSDLLGAMTA